MDSPNLIIENDFVGDAQELHDALATGVTWDERMQARRTATFGKPYNYSSMTYPETPMHPLLVPVVDRLETRLGFRPNNCLLNYYETGDATMGFHADATDNLIPGTGVAIVSLGAERTITFRRTKDRTVWCHYPLPNGSLLYMGDDVQQEWQHAIRKQEGIGSRISLTFRAVAEP